MKVITRLLGIILFSSLVCYLLATVSSIGTADYYDNTSVESRVNVTNKAPRVSDVILYEADDGSQTAIDLSEGSTENLTCNATVEDWNGWSDILAVNATIYDAVGYQSDSGTDNNYNYFQGSCSNETLNSTAKEFTCTFAVWYYANNATWNCNVTAIDNSNAIGFEIDATPPTINLLAAINLSSNLIDFGNMQPGATTADADEPTINITNTGNVNLNLSVAGFGAVDGDGLAMNCTVGNISKDYMKFNYTAQQTFDASMWNLSDEGYESGVEGLRILQRVDDNDNSKLNSSNTTYWKIRIPSGVIGFCNGTVTFAGVV